MTMKSCAFFDIDGTVLNIKSMFSFVQFYWSHRKVYGERAGEKKYQAYINEVKNAYSLGASREAVNISFYKNFSKHSIALVDQISEEWWQSLLANGRQLFYLKSLALIRRFQEKNIEVILVSGSMSPCTDHIKKALNVSCSLNTVLVEDRGKYTGEIAGRVMIGEGKRYAIECYAKEHMIDLDKSFSYGDDYSDIPMLQTTRYRAVIHPEEKLKAYALKNHWKIIANNES